jgi:AcrR family transcriptional regulator
MVRKPAEADTDGAATAKSARTRARILDSAAFVLSRKGYSGTRLTDVAEHAGLQAPAIYYYFPKREDLIEEVMWVGIAEQRRYLKAVLDALPEGASPLDRLDAAVEAHLRHELESSDYATASIRNSGQVPEHIRGRQAAEDARYGTVWRELIGDIASAGIMRPELDPHTARMLILGALNWAAEWWNPRRGSLDTLVSTAQTMVRHGLTVEAADDMRPNDRRPRRGRTPATRGTATV